MENRREYDFTTPEGVSQFGDEHLLPLQVSLNNLDFQMRENPENITPEQLIEWHRLRKTLTTVENICLVALQGVVTS